MQHPARICGKNRRRKAAIHLKSGAENHGLSAADADNFSKNAEKALKGEREAVEENNKALQQHSKDMGEAAQSEKEKVNISNELSKVLEKEKANLNNAEKASSRVLKLKEIVPSTLIFSSSSSTSKYS